MGGTCKDCKHWDTKFPSLGIEPDVGVCGLTMSSGNGPDDNSTMAWAQDAEYYFAYLKTRGGFGCNQFEAKS